MKWAEQLNHALASLRSANWQLKKDIEREREQEKQRVEFFTAVSHELKTPIAIIKGQLEGMIYQVGEYKDRDTYLRRCMKTTNDMETLVKEILSAARMGGSDFHLERTDLDISQCCERSASSSVAGWRTSKSSFAWTSSRNTTTRGTGGSWRRCSPM